ncbi:MAG: hypothetical protein KDB22_23465 [Planctomycetales bacterium]|nr:hypothetical protein [Planctomycetales bacterium]
MLPLPRALFIALIFVRCLSPGIAQENQGLRLTQVQLYSAGMARFTYAAEVETAQTLRLSVPKEDVSDVLRSVEVQDSQQGLEFVRVVVASPIATDPQPLPSLDSRIDLLMSLRGQLIEIDLLSGSTHVGRLVSLENSLEQVDKHAVERVRVSIASRLGVESFLLDEIVRFRCADPAVEATITAALDRQLTSEQPDLTEIEFGFRDAERRVCRISLMRPQPVWKCAYLLHDSELRMRIVVDNTTHEDWRQVDLQILDGQPIAFRTNIYQSIVVHRRSLPLSVGLPGLPPVFADEEINIAPGTTKSKEALSGLYGGYGAGEGGYGNEGGYGGGGMGGGMGGMAMGGSVEGAYGASVGNSSAAFDNDNRLGLAFTPELAGVASEAGDALSIAFSDVTIPAQTTALLVSPVLPVTATKSSLYFAGYDPNVPLQAVELQNTGKSLLPGGPLSIYESDAYVGDAMLPRLSAGKSRMASYALDGTLRVARQIAQAEVKVDTLEFDMATKTIDVTELHSITESYQITNYGSIQRMLLLELPQISGWSYPPQAELVQLEEAVRVRTTIDPTMKVTQNVVRDRAQDRQLSFAGTSEQELVELQQQSGVSDLQRQRIENLIGQRRQVDALVSTFEQLKKQLLTKDGEIDRMVRILSTEGLSTTTIEGYVSRIEESETQRKLLQQQVEATELQLRELNAVINSPGDSLGNANDLFESDATNNSFGF